MAFDTSRLYSTLLTSRLQQDNPPLYQVIYQLIGALSSVQGTVGSLSNSIENNTVNEVNNIIQIVSGNREGSGGSNRVIPGPAGAKGDTGASGPSLPGPLGIIKHYVESYPKYIPVIGNQGNPGTTGAQGPIGAVIRGRNTEVVKSPIQIFQGSSSSGSLVYLSSQTASTSATLSFTSLITATYNNYIFEFLDILPATNGALFRMLVSTNNGVSYDSGTNYATAYNRWSKTGQSQGGAASDTNFDIAGGLGVSNDATEQGLSGFLKFFNPLGTSGWKKILSDVSWWYNGTPELLGATDTGAYKSATAVNAVQFLMSSGNITSGAIHMYGVKNS